MDAFNAIPKASSYPNFRHKSVYVDNFDNSLRQVTSLGLRGRHYIVRTDDYPHGFLLDTLTEMLTTPLRLLSYVQLRVAVSDKLMSGHELTVLGYHLKQNLWLHEKYDKVMLDDSMAQELGTAMLVRRDNLPGDDTPIGILTTMRGTRYEQLLNEIETKANPATLELGFHLLSMDEDSCKSVHRVLETITRKALLDGNPHDGILTSSKPIVRS